MHQRTTLSAAALLLLGGIAGLAQAQQTTDQGAQKLERVEVVGSAIKRTNAEGVSPVEVLSRKQIERTGATSVNELLRSIPSIDIFDQGELASNSPAGSGTANIAMRGLSSSEVLVLVNGRRMPVNALYDSSGAGAAFDINSLPIGAIERVEILKDGGSALYGADAIAGVINFVTKTDYQGIEAAGSWGRSSRGDGTEKRASLAAGFGDLSTDRFNVLVGLDVLKRDPILRKDRPLSNSVNFTALGGNDARSSFAPTGNVVNPANGANVMPYKECAPDDISKKDGLCKYDFNKSLLTAYNGADRVSAMGVASFQINPDTKAFVEATYSHSKDRFESHPVPDYFIVPITDASQRPYEILDENGNGTGKIYIAGRFMQGGPRITERVAKFMNVATGLEGTFHNYDWKVSLSRGQSKVTNRDFNYFDATKWVDATSSGAIDPTVSTNDAAFVDDLKVRPVRTGKSVLTTFNAQVSGDVVQLPAGAMKFAVGVNVNRESLNDTPDPLTQAGDVVGSIRQAAVDAARTYKAVYTELSIPILKSLEAQAAARYDKYPNADATSPRVGLKWTAMPELAFRASYTRSFRAPVLKQLYGAQEQGAATITNPDQCRKLGVTPTPDPDNPGEEICSVSAFEVNGSNPNLQPEKGKTFNIGAVLEPFKDFNASIDWWKIKKTNDISSPTLGSAIDAGNWIKEGARISIFTNLQNIAEHETSGVDVDARWRLGSTAIGNVTLRNLLSYYFHNKKKSGAGDEWEEFSGTYATPRFRNTFNVSVENGPWAYGVSWRTVGGFWDTDEARPLAADTKRVGAHEEGDVLVQYSGIKNLELSFGVKNIFDRMPPFSKTNANSNLYTQMGFAELYTNRGRYFQLGAKYTFR